MASDFELQLKKYYSVKIILFLFDCIQSSW